MWWTRRAILKSVSGLSISHYSVIHTPLSNLFWSVPSGLVPAGSDSIHPYGVVCVAILFHGLLKLL